MVLFTDPNQITGLTPAAAEQLRLSNRSTRSNPSQIVGTGRNQVPWTSTGLASGQSKSYFKITYYAIDGKERTFMFALLPAIENYLPIQGSGAKVPEVKTGIQITTRMRHRNIAVPGSTPVIQSIGPDSTTMQLTGLFVGNELFDVANSIGPPTFSGSAGQTNAFDISRIFNNEIVLPSIPVFIDIFSSLSGGSFNVLSGATPSRFTRIYVRGLITSFRSCTSRENRSYYALDILLTDYLQRQRLNPDIPEEVRAQEQIVQACVVDFERYRRELNEYNRKLAESPRDKDAKTKLDPPKPISEQCVVALKKQKYPGAEALEIQKTNPAPKAPQQR